MVPLDQALPRHASQQLADDINLDKSTWMLSGISIADDPEATAARMLQTILRMDLYDNPDGTLADCLIRAQRDIEAEFSLKVLGPYPYHMTFANWSPVVFLGLYEALRQSCIHFGIDHPSLLGWLESIVCQYVEFTVVHEAWT